MIFIQHLNKLMFFVTIIEISKLQGVMDLVKGKYLLKTYAQKT